MSRIFPARIVAPSHSLLAPAAKRASLLAIGVAALVTTVPSVQAQVAPAGKPLSIETMNDLTLAAAVNSCEMAVESKIPVEKAVLSTAKAITYVVTSRYGSQIADTGKLSPDQIANGTIIQIVGRVRQGCFDKLGAADKKFVDGILTEYSNAVKNK